MLNLDAKKLNRLLFFLFSASIFLLFTIFHFATNWEWSLLGDDYNYYHLVKTSAMTAWQLALEQIEVFGAEGRFVPLYSLFVNFWWKTLPLSPFAFHFFLYFVFVLIIISTYLLTASFEVRSRLMLLGAVFLFIFSQRAILDVLVLTSIPETWLILFLSIGLLLYRKSPIWARISFLLSALLKEPGWIAFAAAGAVGLWDYFVLKDSKKRLYSALFDILIFVAVAIFIKQVSLGRGQSYLQSYSFFSFSTIYNFGLGLLKSSFVLLPVTFLLLATGSARFWRYMNRVQLRFFLFLLIYAFGYLGLVAPRNASGYLTIPAAYMFSIMAIILTMVIIQTRSERFERKLVFFPFLLLISLVLFQSIYRQEGFKNGLYQTTTRTRELASSPNRSLLLLQGHEQIVNTRLYLSEIKSNDEVRIVNQDNVDYAMGFPGSVFALLNIKHFPWREEATTIIKNSCPDLLLQLKTSHIELYQCKKAPSST